MKGAIAALLMGITVATSPGKAQAQCSPTASQTSYIPYATGYVSLYAGAGIDLNAVYTAAGDWNGSCRGGGPAQPNPFPYLSVNTNSCQYCVEVVIFNGHGPLDPQTNQYPEGRWDPPTQTIFIYTEVGSPGATYESQWRSSVAQQNTIEHEIGHVLGLGHSTCPGEIMNPGDFGDVTPADCSIADSLNTTDSEVSVCRPDDYDCRFSPIVIRLGDTSYSLTSAADGVSFDITADGQVERIGWTAPRTALAFLWIDRNGNRTPDNGAELFGNSTPLRSGGSALNGFVALAELDSNKDGTVDARDVRWNELRLWIDRNHNGIAEPEEILSLAQGGILAFELQYSWTGRHDRFGNRFRWEGFVRRRAPEGQVLRESIYDIVFTH